MLQPGIEPGTIQVLRKIPIMDAIDGNDQFPQLNIPPQISPLHIDEDEYPLEGHMASCTADNSTQMTVIFYIIRKFTMICSIKIEYFEIDISLNKKTICLWHTPYCFKNKS